MICLVSIQQDNLYIIWSLEILIKTLLDKKTHKKSFQFECSKSNKTLNAMYYSDFNLNCS